MTHYIEALFSWEKLSGNSRELVPLGISATVTSVSGHAQLVTAHFGDNASAFRMNDRIHAGVTVTITSRDGRPSAAALEEFATVLTNEQAAELAKRLLAAVATNREAASIT